MNNLREKWIISLVLVGALFSLAVAVPMILISWPGDECLLFVRWVIIIVLVGWSSEELGGSRRLVAMNARDLHRVPPCLAARSMQTGSGNSLKSSACAVKF